MISKKFSSKLKIGVSRQQTKAGDHRIGLEISNEFRVRVRNHIKLYYGLRYSIDGMSWMIGFKVAGAKVKLPFLTIQ